MESPDIVVRLAGMADADFALPIAKSCVNYPILTTKEHKHCLCTAMLFDPCLQ